jgi:23S rRNA pseudouridine1911/1915/1917 synthase
MTNVDDSNLIKILKVDPKQSPCRLDVFIQERIVNISRNRVQQAIINGKILVNDESLRSNYKVRPGDVITIEMLKAHSDDYTITPQKIDFEIIYEDDALMVIHKPPGLVVHPGIGNPDGTLVNGLAYYLQEELPVLEGNSSERMGLVHRIDKNTSGLLVIAKTDEAMRSLSRQFMDHSIEREYVALVWGELEPESGEIEGYIARDIKDRRLRSLYETEDEGKWSKTHYETIETFYYVSLIKCRLETGRTHQIRVHMSSVGHPLFGDEFYGGDKIRKGTVFTKYKQFVQNCFGIMNRHALHARTLGFIHPVTGKKMSFSKDIPEDFQSLIDKWRKYVSSRQTL